MSRKLEFLIVALLSQVMASALISKRCRAQHSPANTGLSVQYSKTEACIKCHRQQYETYLLTTHSRSMEAVDLANENVSAKFHHDASNNDYQVFAKDNQMIHREVTLGADGKELAQKELPILYTVGSGDHGKSYVYKNGNHYGQSPLSCYIETKKWQMSPGYDQPFHPGFGRSLSTECFFCHVGGIKQESENANVFSFTELAIGCERCHGPGELHVAKYSKNPEPDPADNTICNPASLSRELSEAICQQCHLQAAGKAIVSEKREWDFRPGLPLTDFRVDYQYQLGDDSMRVVGHVEQLHASKCYQETETLTCITCHDPHHRPVDGVSEVSHYREICQKCHQPKSTDDCSASLAMRIEKTQNDCSRCHMPELDTEVPHTAFRHHRIGIHANQGSKPEVIKGLTAVLDTSSLSAFERKRTMAIAKFQVGQEGLVNVPDLENELIKTMIELKNTGRPDPDITAILSTLALAQRQPEIASNLATEVVDGNQKNHRARVEALRVLAQLAYARQDFKSAAEHYGSLTKIQSEPTDFFYLGVCQQNRKDSLAAIASLSKAIELDPTNIQAHQVLGAIYERRGNSKEAKHHQEMSDRIVRRMRSLEASAQRRMAPPK